jgi:hypothetical protein
MATTISDIQLARNFEELARLSAAAHDEKQLPPDAIREACEARDLELLNAEANKPLSQDWLRKS